MLRVEIKVPEPTVPATGSSKFLPPPPGSGTAYTPSSLTNDHSTPVSNPPSATQSSFTTTTPSSSLNTVARLGRDAIIGIAVGGAVLIAIMGTIGRIYFRYRRRRTGNAAYNVSLTPMGKQWSTIPPLPSGSEVEYRPQRAEVGGGRYFS